MAASYPSAVKSFPTLNPGDTIQDTDPEAAYDEIAAIETELVTTGLTNTLLVNAGVKFPAVQAASSNANTLDDYEEGSWTPTITGSGGASGQAYTNQVGRYIKVGKLVTCWGRVTLSTLGTVTTDALIGGLPFAAGK